jgi:COP9 signalosome complex subunit 7
MLTLTTLAQRSKTLDYQDLMQALHIESVRELEDLMIDCIYNELLTGQLDQRG